MIKIENLYFTYNSFEKDSGFLGSLKDFFKRREIKKSAIEDFNLEIETGEIVGILGPNGSGKTTFLNYIKEQIPNNFKVAYFEQNNLEIFEKEETVINFIRNITDIEEKELRNILALLNFRGTDINKKVSVLSNGEKVKLYFISLLFQETDVLLLDELTNFLDIVTIEAVEKILSKYPGILIMVSHDSQFVKNVATKVIELNSKEILKFR